MHFSLHTVDPKSEMLNHGVGHAASRIANRFLRTLALGSWRICRVALQDSRFAFHSSNVVPYVQLQK